MVVLMMIVLLNIIYTNENIRLRYDIASNSIMRKILPLNDIRGFEYFHWDFRQKWKVFLENDKINRFLAFYGVTKNSRVYVPSDESPAVSLYFLNRNGFTRFSHLSANEIKQLKIPYEKKKKNEDYPFISQYTPLDTLDNLVIYHLR